MAYKLFTDKTKLFECDVKLEGASLEETQARLVIESDNHNILLYGKIDESGTCTIPITKMKRLLPENSVGNMKLEIIAEDTYFIPWEDAYEVDTSKKVTVEVKNNTQKKVVSEKAVSVVNINSEKTLIANPLLEQFDSMDINYKKLLENKKTLLPIIKNYFISIGSSSLKKDINEFITILKQK